MTIHIFLLKMTVTAIVVLIFCIVVGYRRRSLEGWALVGDLCGLITAILGTTAFMHFASDQERAWQDSAYRSRITSAYAFGGLGCSSNYSRFLATAEACSLLDEEFRSSFSFTSMANHVSTKDRLNYVAQRLEDIRDRKPPKQVATDGEKDALSMAIANLRGSRDDLDGLAFEGAEPPIRLVLVLLTAYLAVCTAVVKAYVTLARLWRSKLDIYVSMLDNWLRSLRT